MSDSKGGFESLIQRQTGEPKTTLRYDNSLRELNRAKKLLLAPYGFIATKGTDSNPPREETHGTESRRVPHTQNCQLSPPAEVQTAMNSSPHM